MIEATPDGPPLSHCLPWNFHPALTDDRLRLCSRLPANARRDSVALAAYEMGDDSWSIDCRVYFVGYDGPTSRAYLESLVDRPTNLRRLKAVSQTRHPAGIIVLFAPRRASGVWSSPSIRTEE